MKKLDAIKEYIIKNNITSIGGCYINDNYEYHIDDESNIMKRINNISNNIFPHVIIKSIKKSDTTYLIDIYTKKYQKIGNFKKGEELGEQIDLYFRSDKYYNEPRYFIDKLKNEQLIDNQYFNIPIEENIQKYYDFWIENFFKYPENRESILKRLRLKDQRRLKLKEMPYVL